jgi:hypothetical protein
MEKQDFPHIQVVYNHISHKMIFYRNWNHFNFRSTPSLSLSSLLSSSPPPPSHLHSHFYDCHQNYQQSPKSGLLISASGPLHSVIPISQF